MSRWACGNDFQEGDIIEVKDEIFKRLMSNEEIGKIKLIDRNEFYVVGRNCSWGMWLTPNQIKRKVPKLVYKIEEFERRR
jgi:hypothetical protein